MTFRGTVRRSAFATASAPVVGGRWTRRIPTRRSASAVPGPAAQNSSVAGRGRAARRHGRTPAATAVRLVTTTVSGSVNESRRFCQIAGSTGRGSLEAMRIRRTRARRSNGSIPSSVPGTEKRTIVGGRCGDMPHLPARRGKEVEGSPVQEFLAQPRPEGCGVRRGPATVQSETRSAIGGQHLSGHRHRGSPYGGERSERNSTVPPERGREGSFRGDACMGRPVVDPGNERGEDGVTGPPHDRDRSLGGRRKERSGREDTPDLRRSPQTRDPGHGQYRRVDRSRTDETDPRIDVPSDLDDPKVGSPTEELGTTAQAARADPCSPRQPRRTLRAIRDETVARVGPRGTREEVEPAVEFGGKVLRAVHREIHLSPQQCSVDRVGKSADPPTERAW